MAFDRQPLTGTARDFRDIETKGRINPREGSCSLCMFVGSRDPDEQTARVILLTSIIYCDSCEDPLGGAPTNAWLNLLADPPLKSSRSSIQNTDVPSRHEQDRPDTRFFAATAPHSTVRVFLVRATLLTYVVRMCGVCHEAFSGVRRR